MGRGEVRQKGGGAAVAGQGGAESKASRWQDAAKAWVLRAAEELRTPPPLGTVQQGELAKGLAGAELAGEGPESALGLPVAPLVHGHRALLHQVKLVRLGKDRSSKCKGRRGKGRRATRGSGQR